MVLTETFKPEALKALKGDLMKRKLIALVATSSCMLLLVASLFSGCMGGNQTPVNTEQQANRSYMSQVNDIMDELSEGLESFVEAVSSGDAVNVKTQADSACQVLDKLSSLEAPDDLKDIQTSYSEGTNKLRQALNEYIALYTEIEAGNFNQTTYDDRMESIQALYDEGVATLKKGDEDAAAL